ncbi:RNA polymerase sigma C factor [Bacillus sp. NRRL B-14911]|nr:RNA polymerase sigma C factor [Bacillus sp. NRRL B-14911]
MGGRAEILKNREALSGLRIYSLSLAVWEYILQLIQDDSAYICSFSA